MSGDEGDLPVVYVRVVVNVDSLRRGYEGEVELTPRIQQLVKAGYLQILGHVWVPPEPAPVVEGDLPVSEQMKSMNSSGSSW